MKTKKLMTETPESKAFSNAFDPMKDEGIHVQSVKTECTYSKEQKAIELATEIQRLRRQQDNVAACYTDAFGNWKTKRAEREYSKLDRMVEKLDAEYNQLDMN